VALNAFKRGKERIVAVFCEAFNHASLGRHRIERGRVERGRGNPRFFLGLRPRFPFRGRLGP
jgi:hypothetical protein